MPSDTYAHALGIMPLLLEVISGPNMEKLLPLPVCPYANMVLREVMNGVGMESHTHYSH